MKSSMVRLLFLFLNGSIFLWQIFSKKSKLLVEAEIWNLDLFEYVELDGDFHFILFDIGNTLFGLIWSKKSKLSV